MSCSFKRYCKLSQLAVEIHFATNFKLKKNCLNETVLACDIGNKCVYLPEEFAAAIKNEEQLRQLNKAPRTMIYFGRAPRSLR